LPSWISFDPIFLAFGGSAPTTGTNLLNLKATNSYNDTAVTNFTLKVVDYIMDPSQPGKAGVALSVIIGASVGGALGFAALLGGVAYLIYRGTYSKNKDKGPTTSVQVSNLQLAETVDTPGL